MRNELLRTDLWIHCRIILLAGLLGFLSALFSPLGAVTGGPGDFDALIKEVRGALTRFDLDAARSLLSQACRREVSAWDPSVEVSSPRVAICETEMGVIEEAARRPATAEAHYLRALGIWEKLAPEYAVPHATTLMNLGSLYRTQHRMAEAEPRLTRAYEMIRGNGESDLPLRALATGRLGLFYGDAGAPERGRQLLAESVAMYRNLPHADPVQQASACSSLGMLILRTGDYKTAESHLREAVSLSTNSVGEDHPDTAIYQSNLALALYLEGRYDGAELLLHRARHILEARLPGSVETGASLATLTVVETALGQFGQAATDGEKALAILSARPGADSLDVAFAKVALAEACLRGRKLDEASRLLPEAIALERQLAGDPRMQDQRVLAYAIRALGEVRAAQHRWAEAQALYSEAIGIYETALGDGHPSIKPVLREYAEVLKHAGAPRAEVKRVEAKAKV